jgi:hypothetical protein
MALTNCLGLRELGCLGLVGCLAVIISCRLGSALWVSPACQLSGCLGLALCFRRSCSVCLSRSVAVVHFVSNQLSRCIGLIPSLSGPLTGSVCSSLALPCTLGFLALWVLSRTPGTVSHLSHSSSAGLWVPLARLPLTICGSLFSESRSLPFLAPGVAGCLPFACSKAL